MVNKICQLFDSIVVIIGGADISALFKTIKSAIKEWQNEATKAKASKCLTPELN